MTRDVAYTDSLTAFLDIDGVMQWMGPSTSINQVYLSSKLGLYCGHCGAAIEQRGNCVSCGAPPQRSITAWKATAIISQFVKESCISKIAGRDIYILQHPCNLTIDEYHKEWIIARLIGCEIEEVWIPHLIIADKEHGDIVTICAKVSCKLELCNETIL